MPIAEKFWQSGNWLLTSLKSRAIQESQEKKRWKHIFPLFCFLSFFFCISVETRDVRGNRRICSRAVNLFYLAKQTSAIFRTRQDARRYIVHRGCTIHHFKHIVSSPANTAAHPRCRQFPAPGPRPLIHYMAVFLSHLLAHTKPYTFVSFVIVCQVLTTMGRAISPVFIGGRFNLHTTATEINAMALNISRTPLVGRGTESSKHFMILFYCFALKIKHL